MADNDRRSEAVPGAVAEPTGAAPTRKRVRLQITVHPLTEVRLATFSERFRLTYGRMIDKWVAAVDTAYQQGRRVCIDGRPCKLDLTDLPEVW